MHGEFLTLADAKMAKSAGNIIRVSELPSKGFQPLDFRYLALTAHYRSKLDFTHAAMEGAGGGDCWRGAGPAGRGRPLGGADGRLPRAVHRGDQRRPGHAGGG